MKTKKALLIICILALLCCLGSCEIIRDAALDNQEIEINEFIMEEPSQENFLKDPLTNNFDLSQEKITFKIKDKKEFNNEIIESSPSQSAEEASITVAGSGPYHLIDESDTTIGAHDEPVVADEEYPDAAAVWRILSAAGCSDYVCAGILGNMMAECGGQTLALQPYVSSSDYYGMCQWNQAYRDKVWGASLEDQCSFLLDTMKYEIDTFGFCYASGFNYDKFLNLTNEKDVALAFAKCYERCGSGSYSIRKDNATTAYNYFVTD